MSITLATIITNYDAVGTMATETASRYAALIALGSRPTFPVDVAVSTDYNDVLTSQATYDAAYAVAIAAYNTAVAAQKVGEATCIASMAPNQWFKMTGLANWGSAATQYIGIANNSPSAAVGLNFSGTQRLFGIYTYPTLPTRNFPNV